MKSKIKKKHSLSIEVLKLLALQILYLAAWFGVISIYPYIDSFWALVIGFSILGLAGLSYFGYQLFVSIKFLKAENKVLSVESTSPKENSKKNIRFQDLKFEVIPKLFTILLVLFFGIFSYQLFSAYIEIQNTFVAISEIDPRIKYNPPQATIIASIPDALTISFLTLIVVAVGTISTLILGWRNEIRNKRETQLRIEKLELEIAELKNNQESIPQLIYTEISSKGFDKPHLSLEKKKI